MAPYLEPAYRRDPVRQTGVTCGMLWRVSDATPRAFFAWGAV